MVFASADRDLLSPAMFLDQVCGVRLILYEPGE